MRTHLSVLLVTAGLFGMVPLHAETDPRAAEGAALLAPFRAELKTALEQGLAQGPEAAIDACRVEAPRIVESQSRGGVRMGRTSHRLRNPANSPPAWAEALLAAYASGGAMPESRLVPLDGAGWGYVEPIVMQPPCLLCHGRELAPEVAARLAAWYPEDQATGFEVGDFRGLFWVEFPASR